jgi:hypothetical protein
LAALVIRSLTIGAVEIALNSVFDFRTNLALRHALASKSLQTAST